MFSTSSPTYPASVRAGGVGDRERDVEDLGEGLGEQRLAGAGRADQEDVRLLELDVRRRWPPASIRL